MVVHTKLKEIKGTGHDGSGGTEKNTEKSGWMETDGRMEGGRPAPNEQGTERTQNGSRDNTIKKDPYTRVSQSRCKIT